MRHNSGLSGALLAIAIVSIGFPAAATKKNVRYTFDFNGGFYKKSEQFKTGYLAIFRSEGVKKNLTRRIKLPSGSVLFHKPKTIPLLYFSYIDGRCAAAATIAIERVDLRTGKRRIIMSHVQYREKSPIASRWALVTWTPPKKAAVHDFCTNAGKIHLRLLTFTTSGKAKLRHLGRRRCLSQCEYSADDDDLKKCPRWSKNGRWLFYQCTKKRRIRIR